VVTGCPRCGVVAESMDSGHRWFATCRRPALPSLRPGEQGLSEERHHPCGEVRDELDGEDDEVHQHRKT
jgi:hypothetical protein